MADEVDQAFESFIDQDKFHEEVNELKRLRDFVEDNIDSHDPDIHKQLTLYSIVIIDLVELLKIKHSLIKIVKVSERLPDLKDAAKTMFDLYQSTRTLRT